MSRVLVAGATGALGRAVVEEARRRGHVVRALTRSLSRAQRAGLGDVEVAVADACAGPGALSGAVAGIEVVVSALGASVMPSLVPRAGFAAVDTRANLHLIEAALDHGVRRFVCVSAFGRGILDGDAYVDAHEAVAERLAASPMSYSVVRPTGFFSSLLPFLDMARRGLGVVIGDGEARTNPIHDQDLAALIARLLDEGPPALDAGGPDVLTRDEIACLAFEALGRRSRLVHIPCALTRLASAVLRPLHPRLGELLAFFERIHREDLIAPVAGDRRLVDFFVERADRPRLREPTAVG